MSTSIFYWRRSRFWDINKRVGEWLKSSGVRRERYEERSEGEGEERMSRK